MRGLKLGLRIDVDTFRGTKLGVPGLCDVLKKHGVKGTFFFSVGPDNMGRHLWRLLRPAFLLKMLRSNASSLYGWDILLRGAFFPGPVIGEKLAAQIKRAAEEGHEIGLHAWDHHAWQAKIATMDDDAVFRHLENGFKLLEKICGRRRPVRRRRAGSAMTRRCCKRSAFRSNTTATAAVRPYSCRWSPASG